MARRKESAAYIAGFEGKDIRTKSEQDAFDYLNGRIDHLTEVAQANFDIVVEQLKERQKMRVNVYAEEMTDRVEVISKEIEGHTYTGLRIYLELPVTKDGEQVKGPFMHKPGDDDSSAVTFWGKADLREVLVKALAKLDAHYASRAEPADPQRTITYDY